MSKRINLIMVKFKRFGKGTGPCHQQVHYRSEHVNTMVSMFKRNVNASRYEVVPYCLTDDTTGIDKAECIPIWIQNSKLEGWWNKLMVFDRNVSPLGVNVYMDLDQVIVGDLTDILDLCIHQPYFTVSCYSDLNMMGNRRLFGSAMMIWRGTYQHRLWDSFIKNPPCMHNDSVGDQVWLHQNIPESEVFDFLAKFPNAVQSYRLQVQKDGLHKDAKIVNFHGIPKPWMLNDDFIKEHYR